MGLFSVNDFSKGWDLRKGAVGASPQSLRVLDNAFINSGGEIEKRKAHPIQFPQANLAPFTQIGLSGSQYPTVFGPPPTPASWYTLNPGLLYQPVIDIQYADRVLDVATFDGQFYVVSRNAAGSIFNRYGVTAVDNGLGSNCIHTFRNKIYCISPTMLFFSALNNPVYWSNADGQIGAGNISLDTQDIGYADLRALDTYYNQLAVIGSNSVQLWNIASDPAGNNLAQIVSNIGAIVPNGVARVGDGDLLMVHFTGIRSMRARSVNNAASTTDTGSPIDEAIRARISRDFFGTPIVPNIAEKIAARVDPTTGQFWLFWDKEIFVLSLIPGAEILAWSRYTVPYSIEYAAAAGGKLYYRDVTGIRVVGGTTNDVYDDTVAEIVTPFYDAQKPTDEKMWTGFDFAAQGTWQIEACSDPLHPDAWAPVATITGPSYSQHKIGMQFSSTHIAFRLRSVGTGPARIGAIHLQFQGDDPQ